VPEVGSSPLPLPSTSRIKPTSGFVGQQLTQLLLDKFSDVKIITTDVVLPPRLVEDEQRLKVVKADLGDKAQVQALFDGEEVGGVYALQ